MAGYAGMALSAVYDMDVFTFWALLRDAVIYNRSQTTAGRDWLKNAWRLTQTEPDEEAVDREIARGGKNNGR